MSTDRTPTDPQPQPTQKDLSYPDLDDADVHGLRLADLDPESDVPPDRLDDEPVRHEGPAEGPDIG